MSYFLKNIGKHVDQTLDYHKWRWVFFYFEKCIKQSKKANKNMVKKILTSNPELFPLLELKLRKL